MSITKIRSSVAVSGTLKGLDDNTSIVMRIRARLRRLYPEADQKVFSYIIVPLIQSSADTVSDETFKGIVKMVMLEVASGMFPDRGYTGKTEYAVVYASISDHMKTVRGDRGNKT